MISSGEGNLTEGIVTIDGVDYQVTTYTNPKTGLSMTPGAGWNYNPGAVNWTPNMNRYDPDIARLA